MPLLKNKNSNSNEEDYQSKSTKRESKVSMYQQSTQNKKTQSNFFPFFGSLGAESAPIYNLKVLKIHNRHTIHLTSCNLPKKKNSKLKLPNTLLSLK